MSFNDLYYRPSLRIGVTSFLSSTAHSKEQAVLSSRSEARDKAITRYNYFNTDRREVSGCWHLTPDTWHLAPDTRHLLSLGCSLTPNSEHSLNTRFLASQRASSLLAAEWQVMGGVKRKYKISRYARNSSISTLLKYMLSVWTLTCFCLQAGY